MRGSESHSTPHPHPTLPLKGRAKVRIWIALPARRPLLSRGNPDADGQAHFAFPAGAGRCAIAGRRPRPQYDRTGARAHRAAGPVRRQYAPAAGPGRRQRAGAARAPGRGAGQAAQGFRPGRQPVHRQRPQPPAQRHRQTGPAAWRPVHRQRMVRAGRVRRQGRLGHGLARRGRRQGQAGSGDRKSPRRRERAVRERRGTAPGAGEIHHRPDPARRSRQTRPGDRPRRGNPPHHPGPAAPHQEQPGADRRTRRRQDRDSGGPGPAHRQRRSARRPEEPPRAVAGHGRADRRRQVPRRVRGTAESGPQRPVQDRRAGDPVHRRTAHHGRRRQGRRLHGRRQHAQAGAGARRAALHRRDHAGRIPQVRGKGRRAGTALPESLRGRADGGGHHRHPARAEGTLRGAPRRGDHRPGHRRRRHALAPLYRRPPAAGQGHRSDGRSRLAHPHGDRLQARGTRPQGTPPDPAEDPARDAEEGKGRRIEEASGRSGSRHRIAGARVLRFERSVEIGKGRVAGRDQGEGADRAGETRTRKPRSAIRTTPA